MVGEAHQAAQRQAQTKAVGSIPTPASTAISNVADIGFSFHI